MPIAGNTEKVGRKHGNGHEKMKKLRACGVVYSGLIR
jgi:predicted transcriptional regulator